ncbi:MAG: hypothetical protein MK488_01355 [SAR324 cluster bacterium]|nr:hypothetical protein [SAR324 cluster bacterium]
MTCFLMFLAGCSESKAPPRPFRNPPVSLLDQVKWVCNHGDFTQFVVRERVIYAMSKSDGTPFPLEHINVRLPDGQYFCSEQTRPSKHFE